MLNILIVDDEAPVREWLSYIIKASSDNYNIIGLAASPDEAFTLTVKHIPDVIITDIKMPNMSGIELIKKVKQVAPYTKIIIVTNHPNFEYAKEAISIGTVEYFIKSDLKKEVLISTLNKILKLKYESTSNLNNNFNDKSVDMYPLYLKYKNIDTFKNFINSIGIFNTNCFQVMCINNSNKSNSIDIIKEIMSTLKYDKYKYFTQQDLIFLIIIEENISSLLEISDEFMFRYVNKTDSFIAASDIETNAIKLKKAVLTAKQTYSYSFFAPENKKIEYKKLKYFKNLDKDIISQLYKEILELLEEKNYIFLINKISIFFDTFKNFNVRDTQWAYEICLKTMIIIKESQKKDNELLNIEKITSIEIYKTICINTINKKIDKKYSQRVLETLDLIHNNYNKNITLVEASEYVSTSSGYFSRLFKKEVGESFTTYVIMYKLKKADYLLNNTDYSVSEIAYKIGYDDANYFSRIYKKYMGKSPRQKNE